ncbi:CPBP family intramembrane glutamic endopeptidase [Chelatococcus sp. GCM10030263]|uniref:CPBP family intramembrane glutamic endopeptidase n=1 Tax=Chelatococcus sp. GCM10030263 TaxID=3273387 RepID=UPI00360B09B9
MKSQHPFDRYVNKARGGRLGLWRLAGGVILIIGIAMLSQMIVSWALATLTLVVEAKTNSDLAIGEAWRIAAASLGSWTGSLFRIGSIGAIWIGVWVAVVGLQRRPLACLLGADCRLSGAHFARGLQAALIMGVAGEIAFYVIDPSLHRSQVPIGDWLSWLVPFALALMAQSSAEELLFRGYLVQSLAARFRNPWIWAFPPTIVFAFLHWEPGASGAMNAAILVSIAGFGTAALLVTYLTGDLGAAMGIHFGNNLFALLIASHQRLFNIPALFQSRAFEQPGWSVAHAISVASIGIASLGGTLLLLVHPRSPLRICLAADLVAPASRS